MHYLEYIKGLLTKSNYKKCVDDFFDELDIKVNKCKSLTDSKFYYEIENFCNEYFSYNNLEDDILFKYTYHYAYYLKHCMSVKSVLKKDYKRLSYERIK